MEDRVFLTGSAGHGSSGLGRNNTWPAGNRLLAAEHGGWTSGRIGFGSRVHEPPGFSLSDLAGCGLTGDIHWKISLQTAKKHGGSDLPWPRVLQLTDPPDPLS
jgi:hypothetical protein